MTFFGNNFPLLVTDLINGNTTYTKVHHNEVKINSSLGNTVISPNFLTISDPSSNIATLSKNSIGFFDSVGAKNIFLSTDSFGMSSVLGSIDIKQYSVELLDPSNVSVIQINQSGVVVKNNSNSKNSYLASDHIYIKDTNTSVYIKPTEVFITDSTSAQFNYVPKRLLPTTQTLPLATLPFQEFVLVNISGTVQTFTAPTGYDIIYDGNVYSYVEVHKIGQNLVLTITGDGSTHYFVISISGNVGTNDVHFVS